MAEEIFGMVCYNTNHLNQIEWLGLVKVRPHTGVGFYDGWLWRPELFIKTFIHFAAREVTRTKMRATGTK